MADSTSKRSLKGDNRGYIPAAIISLVIANIPFILFALLYKTPFILESKVWQLIITSLLLTAITLVVNYYLLSLRDVAKLFLNPEQLITEITRPTKMSQIAMQGHKKKKKKELLLNENKYRDILSTKIADKLSIKNQENWYRASVRMTVVFSLVVLLIRFLNIQSYLILGLIVAELLVFIVPLIIDYVKVRSTDWGKPSK